MRVGQSRKRDANEDGIVQALRAIGCKVFRVSGEGLPDLLVAYRGRWMPLEVKSKGGKLTEAQAAAYLEATFAIVSTPEQAIAAVTK